MSSQVERLKALEAEIGPYDGSREWDNRKGYFEEQLALVGVELLALWEVVGKYSDDHWLGECDLTDALDALDRKATEVLGVER